MYDAIVVGARCAGSPTAMLLARHGYRVLLVDKAAFPSDTLSTHFLKRTGCSLLKRWGLLDRVVATGCPPIKELTFQFGSVKVTGTPPAYGGVDVDYAPRRTILDNILLEAALEAGVEVRQGLKVTGLLKSDGRVTGIRGKSASGEAFQECARIVIGADGLGSLVAREVKAEKYFEAPPRTCAYYAYYRGMPREERAELYLLDRERRFLLTFPTHDGLNVVFLFWPFEDNRKVRADLEGSFGETLNFVPDLAKRVRGATRESNIHGMHLIPNYFRKPFGPGWALAGDAALHRDPITAQGITNAFHDAQFLSDALDDVFLERASETDALAGYEAQRIAALKPLYDYTIQIAQLQPFPPEILELLNALPGNQPAINDFLGSFIGSVPLDHFYDPDNMRRIVAAARTV
ncbi:MAG: NAD(P)/FAD-dependent oxidoreductase [Rhodospirillales bacterium]|nr:NAD(P)/FAD-dependent oxidoreductase [Rhodospirillales bacterium]